MPSVHFNALTKPTKSKLRVTYPFSGLTKSSLFSCIVGCDLGACALFM